MTVCGTMNCVIVSSKYIDSISVLYLSCFICYKLLQLLKYAHIFSVYTKMRLFKSQKTSKSIYKFKFSTPKLTKNTYAHSCPRPKIYFCKPVLLMSSSQAGCLIHTVLLYGNNNLVNNYPSVIAKLKRGSHKKVIYEFILTSPAVSHMSSYLGWF